MSLEYVALGMMIFVGIVFFYGIIAIHDIPYEIAKKTRPPAPQAILPRLVVRAYATLSPETQDANPRQTLS